MTKHEIYEALKADGAKLPKAERFMAVGDLKAIYTERFGVSPDEPAKTDAHSPEEEAPNSHLLSDDADPAPDTCQPAAAPAAPQSVPGPCKSVQVCASPCVRIPLLRFIESGWCPALKQSYTRGLCRPKSFAEYEALKPYAEEVVFP